MSVAELLRMPFFVPKEELRLPALATIKNVVPVHSESQLIIDEISRIDVRLDARLSGLLTGDGFVFAVAAFLTTGRYKGIALAASILALISGYLALTAQQYAAERIPGRTAEDQLDVVYGLYKRRLTLARVATPIVGAAIVMVVAVIVLRMV